MSRREGEEDREKERGSMCVPRRRQSGRRQMKWVESQRAAGSTNGALKSCIMRLRLHMLNQVQGIKASSIQLKHFNWHTELSAQSSQSICEIKMKFEVNSNREKYKQILKRKSSRLNSSLSLSQYSKKKKNCSRKSRKKKNISGTFKIFELSCSLWTFFALLDGGNGH